MEEYRIREITSADYPFIANVIVGAEKGNSDKLSFATLFNLDEDEVKRLIVNMLKEETEGCEFSPGSYLVADFNGTPVGAVGAWIECYNGNLSSQIIKSNLLSFFLKKEQIQFLKERADYLSDIIIEREKMTLQSEYMYISRRHRGRNLNIRLMNEHLFKVFSIHPQLKKAQAQVFANNYVAINVFEGMGFKKVRTYKSEYPEIFRFLPFNEKILMEKELKSEEYGKK